ncbi:PKD domain-containing protein [Phaeodactylibacter luteus]|uniref:PKD domain-containing protein n=2 Tax=Phaeodactylibacter luteus TaxID=1564516 RepID=A0A5C6RLD0_9BACT|nr:PKD domain-containing protein [Phaeodactylibacter luteus]
MTYECLGGDQYQITLRVYRDCNCTDCADFDGVANIAVYNCSGNCVGESQSNPVQQIDVPLLDVQNVTEPDYPCLVPPDVCVQEGIYQFNLTLPESPESYFIAYQRCCRNITVSNLIAPGDTGATYFVEITPEAQQGCNSSPVFNEFPPIVICAGAPLEFDHSATDLDGDQLVYSLCASHDGGGNLLSSGLYETCDGARPNPACPPPYDNINFFSPTYTPTQPMGADANLSIDPNTGLLTGTPNNLGQYIVAVCVEEYRNGVLISRTTRDFQFNVASCDPTVVAQVDATTVTPDLEYVITSCGENTIAFGNESFQQANIDTYEWRFMIEGQQTSFNDWEPTVSFPDTGVYYGNLILNPGTICGDTADIRVQIYPDLTADFDFEYDTCVAGETVFEDLSIAESGEITAWSWDFGDGGASEMQDPIYTYAQPGSFPVALTITDINGCQDTRERIIDYFPVPEVIVIAPSEFNGCAPASIFFDNLSTPISEAYDITWEFGDGGSSGAISPTYTYNAPGTYTVAIDIVSPLGCQTDTTFGNLITVRPSPEAGFTYMPEQPSNIVPTVTFTDASSGAIRWFYDFGDGRSSTMPSPAHTYRDTGVYEVLQIVTHPSGCLDTAVQVLDVVPEVRYFLPNAFTPNSDGLNDEYRGTGVLEGASGFQLLIFNRWGEQVFETDDPLEGWNGQKNNMGDPVPAGVYMVLVKFRGPRGEPYEYQSTATVVR